MVQCHFKKKELALIYRELTSNIDCGFYLDDEELEKIAENILEKITKYEVKDELYRRREK